MSVERLVSISRDAAHRELREAMDIVTPADLSTCEMVGMLALLRPARQRLEELSRKPAAVVPIGVPQ